MKCHESSLQLFVSKQTRENYNSVPFSLVYVPWTTYSRSFKNKYWTWVLASPNRQHKSIKCIRAPSIREIHLHVIASLILIQSSRTNEVFRTNELFAHFLNQKRKISLSFKLFHLRWDFLFFWNLFQWRAKYRTLQILSVMSAIILSSFVSSSSSKSNNSRACLIPHSNYTVRSFSPQRLWWLRNRS